MMIEDVNVIAAEQQNIIDTNAETANIEYVNEVVTSPLLIADFIGADRASDGDWNHIGYVTEKNEGAAQRNDYRVAQHSNNYHEWASSSKNGWDTLEADGGTYGRIRR